MEGFTVTYEIWYTDTTVDNYSRMALAETDSITSSTIAGVVAECAQLLVNARAHKSLSPRNSDVGYSSIDFGDIFPIIPCAMGSEDLQNAIELSPLFTGEVCKLEKKAEELVRKEKKNLIKYKKAEIKRLNDQLKELDK